MILWTVLRRHRSFVAIVAIAVVLVTALAPATFDLLCGILAPVDPLFGLVVAEAPAEPPSATLPPSPFVAALDSRGPPVV